MYIILICVCVCVRAHTRMHTYPLHNYIHAQVSLSMCVCVCSPPLYRCSQGPAEGVRAPVPGLIGSCKPPDVDAETQTEIL